MEFRILGPLEIVDGERLLELRGSKKRALLAILLLHTNEVVSRERLLEDLWGDRRPETAATALHGYVSQLRKLLEPGSNGDHRVLLTRPPGYELRLHPDQLDLERFQDLAEVGKRALAAGDASGAAARLREALALWRGRPLAEFDSAPFALVEMLRLEELRLSAIEDRIEADLALGRHHALVAELEMLVAEHSHRERLCAYLMLALYRSGRQAEALNTYQRTRRALVEELGIEPGTMLQRLERAILNHEPSLDLPTTAENEPAEPETSRKARGRRPSRLWRAFAVAALGLLAVALGAAFALRDGESAPILLAPNSVGFVDAESGRVTRSVAVGREPSALAVTNGSVWVANYRDQTVTRIDRATGRSLATIPVGGHPTGITSYRGKVWVWTVEELLVGIDPRFDSASDSLRLAIGGSPRFVHTRDPGRIVAGGGFLWMTAPGTTVIRVEPQHPKSRLPIVPDTGTNGPIAYGEREPWVAGSGFVFPITPDTGIPRSGTAVGGVVHDVAWGDGVWVVSGGPARASGVAPAVRRVDPRTGLLDTTISVGDRPVGITVAAGSTWVASMEDGEGAVYRIDPATNRVVDTITVGSIPTSVAADADGVWVAVK
jgi:YVTN family beta-propeller protein